MEERRVKASVWAYALVVIVAVGAWAALLPGSRAAAPWIYSWDSAAYLESAQSLIDGRGFSQRVIDGLDHRIWQPMSWWPPGYSILIAGGQLLGLPGRDACLAVSATGGAFSIALLSVLALRLLHWSIALPLVLAVALSEAFQRVSVQCMSDTSYLMFVLASVTCVVMWMTTPKHALRWMFAAGLLAGAAWTTRNTGLALFAATGLFLMVHLLWTPVRRVVAVAAAWGLGVVIGAAPLAVHNLIVFGRLNPYDMPSSELSLVHNLRRAAQVVAGDLSTVEAIADLASTRLFLLAAAGVVVLVFAAWALARRGTFSAVSAVAEFARAQRLQILLLSYSALYAAIVIIARTRYRWGEEIDPRHMFQTYWAIWLCMALYAAALLARRDWIPRRQHALLATGFFAIALLQARDTLISAAAPFDRIETMERRIGAPACAYLRSNVPPDAIVLSSRAEILRTFCNVNARKIPPVAQYYKLAPVTREDLYREAQAGFVWGVVIEDVSLALGGGLGPVFQDFAKNPGRQPGFVRVHPESPAIILKYDGRTDSVGALAR